MPTKFQIIYWRDIPSQVVCVDGSRRESRQLSPRFQEAIDRVAMSVGSSGTDEYLADWRKSPWQASDLDVQESCDRKVAELEFQFGPDRLEALLASQGREGGENR